MSDVTRDKPWMCFACGYTMDAASAWEGQFRAPREDDLSLCMNCGEYYVRHADQWVPMTDAERAALELEYVELLGDAERARGRAIRKDLTRGRGGRA
jgi:hypothetical protein